MGTVLIFLRPLTEIPREYSTGQGLIEPTIYFVNDDCINPQYNAII